MVLTKVRLTSVSLCGFVWVQIQSKLMKVLSDLKPKDNQLDAQPGRILNTVMEMLENDKTIFVKKWKDGTYRRVTFLGYEDDDPTKKDGFDEYEKETPKVVIMYTDYGIKKTCSLTELFPFSYFCNIFENIPPQVIICL
jgi:hypothetical protein